MATTTKPQATADAIANAVWHAGYCVTIESHFRWLTRSTLRPEGSPATTNYYENRGHWPTPEDAVAALNRWLDEHPKDPAYLRFRPGSAS